MDGKPLTEGERVHIRWPHGTLTRVEIRVQTVFHGSLRDGQVVEVAYHKAYTRLAVGGDEAKLYLAGFVAQRG